MRARSGSQIGTQAICQGCGDPFVRRKFMQAYCSKRCMTTRGPYGFVTQKGTRGYETAMRSPVGERAVMPSGVARG